MRFLRMFSKPENEERAAVLIVSIGILTALVMMGLTFATLQRMESRGSRNYLDSVSAGQMSNGALQYTIERLRFCNAVGSADALYQVGAAYRTYSVNPEHFTTYYNFQYRVPDGDPTLDSICEVAVLDCSSQIYIGAGLGRMNNLQNVLAALMTYVDSTLFSNADTAAAAIITASGNITDKLQVKGILGEEKYNLLKDYLTVYVPEVKETTNAAAGLNVPELGINVNTVRYQVLYAMLKQMVSGAADSNAAADKLTQEIINNRPYHGWKKSADSTWIGLADVLSDSNLDSTMTSSAFTNADDWHTARDRILANLLPNGQYSSGNLNSYARGSAGWDSLSSFNATYLSLKSSGIYEIQIASRIYNAGTLDVESLSDFESIVQTHDLLHISTQTGFNPSGVNTDFAAIVDGNIELLPEIVATNNISSVDGYLTIKPAKLDSGSTTHFYVDFSDDFDADKADYSTTALVYSHPTSSTGLNSNPLTESSADPGEVCSDGIFIGIDDAGTPNDTSDDFLESIFYKVSDGSSDNFSVNEGTVDFFWKSAVDVSNVTFIELFYLPFKDAASDTGATYNGDDWNNITGVASAGEASNPNLGSANADAGAGMTSLSFKKDGVSDYEFFTGSKNQTEKVTEYQQFLWWFIDGTNMNVRIVGSIAPADGGMFDDDIDNDNDMAIDESGERQPNTPVNFSQDISGLNLKAGDWHHLMLTWVLNNGTGTSIKVYVDNHLLGTKTTDIPLVIDGLKVTVDSDPYSFACFGGLFRRGANATPTGTIDEIRFKKGAPVRTTVATNQRYIDISGVTNPRYISAIYPAADADPLPFGTILGPITWTEYIPDDGSDGSDINTKVWVDLDNAAFKTSAEAEYKLEDISGGNIAFSDPVQGLDDKEPLSIDYVSGKVGARLRIRADFVNANSPDGTNYGGINGPYPNAGSGTVQVRDTAILDDLTLTILLPRPKVLLFRRVDSN